MMVMVMMVMMVMMMTTMIMQRQSEVALWGNQSKLIRRSQKPISRRQPRDSGWWCCSRWWWWWSYLSFLNKYLRRSTWWWERYSDGQNMSVAFWTQFAQKDDWKNIQIYKYSLARKLKNIQSQSNKFSHKSIHKCANIQLCNLILQIISISILAKWEILKQIVQKYSIEANSIEI